MNPQLIQGDPNQNNSRLSLSLLNGCSCSAWLWDKPLQHAVVGNAHSTHWPTAQTGPGTQLTCHARCGTGSKKAVVCPLPAASRPGSAGTGAARPQAAFPGGHSTSSQNGGWALRAHIPRGPRRRCITFYDLVCKVMVPLLPEAHLDSTRGNTDQTSPWRKVTAMEKSTGSGMCR